jgi:hypothetical protein
MVPPVGASRAEQWVAGGRNAAAIDLINLLRTLESELEIHMLVGGGVDLIHFAELSVNSVTLSEKNFQFAHSLLEFTKEQQPEILLYFGAASAPLLTKETLQNSLEQVICSSDPMAVVNNFHSSDWAILNSPNQISKIIHRLPTDNQLGWVMENEGGYRVNRLPYSAESRMDIDTPTDLLMLSAHPDLGPATKGYLSDNTVEANDRVSEIRKLLMERARTLTIIGRSASKVWQKLEAQTQIWIRLFVEERGMVASGRLAQGQVRSLVAEIVDEWGIEAIINFLASVSDGIIWDTRVWMGHKKTWPAQGDRYAADLGWVDEIGDPQLRELTEQINHAPIPIATGGHGAVSGSLLALLDSV